MLEWIPTAHQNNQKAKKGVNHDNSPFGGIGAHFVDFHRRYSSLFQLRTRDVSPISEQYFKVKYDSNTLSPESLEILDKIAEFAIHNPESEFNIKGYTDSTGADSYNLTISKFRANAVKSYLIAKGVDPTKLEIFGLGSQNPIFSNRTAGGRKLNRRVEIELKLDV